ncbi:hypothetical protein EW145_g4700 [Phellinidium pouzarii]|uniref:glucose-6-phosphate 1-epimerase n=1 Tax=Phellinidium pouzarii TaxID=167371 RepID=A0A4S4L2J4_9AGAM|nr:hypothetical protein EW145_g4700 [Phellinidium pouzarii]
MTSVQIQTLLQPPDRDASVQHAVSILNSSFTTLQHLRTGNALSNSLEAAKAVSDRYQSQVGLSFDLTDNELIIPHLAQLASSQSAVDLLIKETRSRAKDLIVSANELSLLRHSLADELTVLSDGLVSSTLPSGMEPSLLEEIEALHLNLKELQSVKEYVLVIYKALQLSEKAVNKIRDTPTSFVINEASVSDYVLLQELVDSVGHACRKAEIDTGKDLKLLSFLKELLERTWSGVKDSLSSSLLSAAENLHWPMPVDYAAAKPESRKAFESAFVNLLKLQEIGKKLHSNKEGDKTDEASRDGLYPLQALIRPVALRFKYHFEGTRQTNRVDKPEWYFAHTLNVSHEHRPFLEIVVQRLLQISKYESITAWREFTRLLLPMVSRKIKRSIPALLPHPPLLAHTVYQALAFDDALREAGFSLSGTLGNSGGDVWEGISDIILGSKDWFDAWLEGERKFAEDQYNDIIISSDAWQIPDDATEDAMNEQEVRPTNSARRVKALIEQITDRYRALPRFLHKTRFLIAVQVPILELYHTRISESLDAFETLSSFLVRAVPGALAGHAGHGRDSKSMTVGVDGSQRLVKAYVSAKWMAIVMALWGEDIFFLELWHQICEKASLRSRVEDVDALPNPNDVKDEGTIFAELVAQYDKLTERAENMLVRQICGEVEADLKAHLFKQPNSVSENDEPILSQTLLGPVARLSAHLSFLHKTLPAPVVVGLYRKIAGHISTHILQRQVLYRGRGRMSSQEGRIVLDEANVWVETSRIALGGGGVRRVETPWEHLLEAGRLLSLEGEAFERVVNAVRLGDEKAYDRLADVLGISEMDSEEVMNVLSGASLEVLLYGATVISWKGPGPDSSALVERLFVSSKAALDGSKPVRGGIPIVFPCFGAPDPGHPQHAKLSQHGYARNSTWAWDGKTVFDNDAGVSVRLTLTPDVSLTGDHVVLAYVITLAEHQLSTDLHVTNVSTSEPVEFQALLHTYLRAPASSVHIDGLLGLTYIDKTIAGTPKNIESRMVTDVQKFTDSVYERAPGKYNITWPEGGVKVKAIGFEDVVIWNPGSVAGSNIGDMEEGGWERYVCIEPGYVSAFKTIQPGETWIGGQLITPIRSPSVFPAVL